MTEKPASSRLPALKRGQPLIVCDADEVLFHFMRGFERYLERLGEHAFVMQSFAITGNVFRRDTGEALDGKQVKTLLDDFFASDTRILDPVAGAAEALAALSADAQIVVLSNLPHARADDRRHALAAHGMDYPLITHSGPKGPMVRTLLDEAEAPAVFIDDLPHQIDSVGVHAPEAGCVHLVADERLARLVPKPEKPHDRAEDWVHARELIGRALSP